MKSDNKHVNQMILSIYRGRHKSNDKVILIPFLSGLFFTLIVAPILFVVLDWSYILRLAIVIIPMPLIIGILLLRKKIIVNNFLKVKEVNDRVEMVELSSDEIEAFQSEKVFMFVYSEYMVKFVYNWFLDLSVIKGDRVRMYKIRYEPGINQFGIYDQGKTFLGIRESDLSITDENREKYEKETKFSILLSDMVSGQVVNVKLYSRITKEEDA